MTNSHFAPAAAEDVVLVTLLERRAAEDPEAVFFTGSSSFLPLNVVGIAETWTTSSGTCRGDRSRRIASRMRRVFASSSGAPSASTTNNTSVPGSVASAASR